jgi:hypothetical protein
MTLTADRVGALRFTSIATDGKRSEVAKEDGHWPRPQDHRSPSVATHPDRSAQVATVLPSAARRNEPTVDPDTKSERLARAARLQAQLNERYVIKHAPLRIGDVTIGQTEYRHRGDTSRVAFTESTFRLSTETNSPSVARSMVDVAEARGWQAIRVSGSDDFKRLIWLEASLRNVKAFGYDPVPGDLELLRKSRETRERAEPAQPIARKAIPDSPVAKQSTRGGSRKAVLAALEAVLVARHVPVAQREAVMAAAAENLSRRLRNGEKLRVKVYDRSAPSQRPEVVAPREPQRARERQVPSR